MSLLSECQARYSNKFLIDLTNPQDRNATTIDTTRFGLAVVDVQTDFRLYAQITFNETDQTHLSIGVKGVIGYLMERVSQTPDQAQRLLREYRNQLSQLALVGARRRIRPQSQPTTETTCPPVFSDSNFSDFILNDPRYRESTELD